MLSQRQEQILTEIIKEYTHLAVPISSDLLLKKSRLDCSPATVRNEMMHLEKEGFLLKPHISAGRVPSDKGYRYFVDRLMENSGELSMENQKHIQVELLKLKAQNQQLSRVTAKLLSATSQCLAFSGIVEKDEYFDFGMHRLLKDPELAELDEISRVSMALDLINENMDALLEKLGTNETKIFIGRENPIKEIQNCSMVISPYKLKSGETGVVAIIGPKRMEYEKNKTLIDYVKKIIGVASVVIILMSVAGERDLSNARFFSINFSSEFFQFF